jgi:hypothetical protein
MKPVKTHPTVYMADFTQFVNAQILGGNLNASGREPLTVAKKTHSQFDFQK